jgi:hypothetical protein
MNELHLQPEWNELDRISQLDADADRYGRAPSSFWTDARRLYKDVCLAWRDSVLAAHGVSAMAQRRAAVGRGRGVWTSGQDFLLTVAPALAEN